LGSEVGVRVSNDRYVHGYALSEGSRLADQAATLESLIHCDTSYPAGSRVIEAGCGVGAQTVPLARNSPGARIVAVDISPQSLQVAAARVRESGISNVEFVHSDLFDLPFASNSFDHLFLCFVLEHLPEPLVALRALVNLLRPGGSVTVVEGDHGSTCFHPDDENARAVIAAQVALQARSGGDANIGRKLYPLLCEAGLDEVRVSPRTVYVDGSNPALAEGFTRRTFTAMMAGLKERALATGILDEASFEAGLKGLRRTAEPDGVFSYTFFKAVASRRVGLDR
jgi:SAM-dependent methyltransferase